MSGQRVVFDERLCPAPAVSVLMITYNHAPFLAEAIEGVVGQVTSFDFELIIGEDHSPDRTLQVALDYQKRYPRIIKVVTADTNVGFGENFRRIAEIARGKYVATCEGDDYWVDRHKLQAQVDMMEADPSLALVHADHAFRQDVWGRKFITTPQGRYAHVTDKTRMRGDIRANIVDDLVTHTSTVMVKADVLHGFLADELSKAPGAFYDRSLNSWYSIHGKAGYLDRVTSIYRVWGGSFMRANPAAYYRMGLDLFLFNEQFQKRFPDFAALYPNTIRRELTLLLMAALKMGDREKIEWANARLRAYGLSHAIAPWKVTLLTNPVGFRLLRAFFEVRRPLRELYRRFSIFAGIVDRVRI